MRKVVLLFLLSMSLAARGQIKWVRGSKMASVSEQVGITDVTITYGRPGVKGREGKIWGNVVPYGFVDYHYGTSKAAPWRAGANENSTIAFSTDVTIEGKSLAAGKYGFFVAMAPEKATLVFSKDNNAWGSFYYNRDGDALRVEVPVIKMTESVEWLKYEFGNQTDSSAVVSLQWEKTRIPFTIIVDLKKTQIAAFRYAFNNGNFYEYWQNMQQAAEFCLSNDVNIQEGLIWADRSINTWFGEANFRTLSTYSGLLEKAGRHHEADSLMKMAFVKGSTQDLFFYGNKLLRMKKYKAAFDVYRINYAKGPKDSYAYLGMAKGYSAIGNKSEAIKFADKSLQIVHEDGFKEYVERVRQGIIDGKEMSEF